MSKLPIYFQLQNEVTAGIGYARTQLSDIRQSLDRLQSALNLLFGPPTGGMKFGIKDANDVFVETQISQMTCKVNEPLEFAVQVDWDSSNPGSGPYSVVPMFVAAEHDKIVMGIGGASGSSFTEAGSTPVPSAQFDYRALASTFVAHLWQQVAQEYPKR